MKPTVRVGQEWEKKDNNREGSTRIRVLEEPKGGRVVVATVAKKGHLIRRRDIFVSALNGAPSGYTLVKDAPEGPVTAPVKPASVDGSVGFALLQECASKPAPSPLARVLAAGPRPRRWPASWRQSVRMSG